MGEISPGNKRPRYNLQLRESSMMDSGMNEMKIERRKEQPGTIDGRFGQWVGARGVLALDTNGAVFPRPEFQGTHVQSGCFHFMLTSIRLRFALVILCSLVNA